MHNRAQIRLVGLTDVPAILAIYEPHIAGAVTTFEDTVPTLTEFGARIKSISANYPYLVYELNGEIVGYAYAYEFRSRPAYRWDVEISVYLQSNFVGKSIGAKLTNALLRILTLMNIQTVYTCMSIPNTASEALHHKLGFSLLGVFPKSGYKLGQWIDVAFYSKTIGSFPASPPAPLKIGEVDKETLARILAESS